MEPINLGQRLSSLSSKPEMPMGNAGGDNVSFPTVYLDDLPADLEVPKSGLVTFRYVLKTITEDVKDEEKGYCMELLQFVSTKGSPKADGASSGAAALDKYVADKAGDSDAGEPDEGVNREDYAAHESD